MKTRSSDSSSSKTLALPKTPSKKKVMIQNAVSRSKSHAVLTSTLEKAKAPRLAQSSSGRSSRGHGGEAVCREVACEGLATSGGYCRLHYIKNWKKIKRKELILREKKLNQYIEELVLKYPDKYIEAIRMDLSTDKDFAKVIYDLDLDEGVDDFDVMSNLSRELRARLKGAAEIRVLNAIG
jgi:hypothetical protein